MGPEGLPEGPDGQPKGPEGPKGLPGGQGVDVLMDIQNFSPVGRTSFPVGAVAQKGALSTKASSEIDTILEGLSVGP